MSQNCNPSEPNDRPIPMLRGPRAFRNFKNPPQPHMCIRDSTREGSELFINVLSWNRIAMPRSPQDPIPLYGGMRVPPTSSNTPPLVFAVMANPDILKTNGRNCPDAGERMALVELLCDFVEAMNPGLVLKRQPVVLPERELSGELKDVWTAVQNKREREREQNIMPNSALNSPHLQAGNSSQKNSPPCINDNNSALQQMQQTMVNQQQYQQPQTSSVIVPNTSVNNKRNMEDKSDGSASKQNCPDLIKDLKHSKNESTVELANNVPNDLKISSNTLSNLQCNEKHSDNSVSNEIIKNGKDFIQNGSHDFFPNFQVKKNCLDNKIGDKQNEFESKSIDSEINLSKLNLQS